MFAFSILNRFSCFAHYSTYTHASELNNINPGSQICLVQCRPESGMPEEITWPESGCRTLASSGYEWQAGSGPHTLGRVRLPELNQHCQHWAGITPTKLPELVHVMGRCRLPKLSQQCLPTLLPHPVFPAKKKDKLHLKNIQFITELYYIVYRGIICKFFWTKYHMNQTESYCMLT